MGYGAWLQNFAKGKQGPSRQSRHLVTEFLSEKNCPEITQPFENSFKVTHNGASLTSEIAPTEVPTETVTYQYMCVFPTTCIAPRTEPLQKNQYSVTNYERKFKPNSGISGIFFPA